jgi:uncharacterized protein (DUF1697 family)
VSTQIVLLRGVNIGPRNRVPMAKLREALEDAVAEPEELVFSGREIYAWHPKGVARSKLWAALAGRGLGVPATARNWTTVTKLLELSS